MFKFVRGSDECILNLLAMSNGSVLLNGDLNDSCFILNYFITGCIVVNGKGLSE